MPLQPMKHLPSPPSAYSQTLLALPSCRFFIFPGSISTFDSSSEGVSSFIIGYIPVLVQPYVSVLVSRGLFSKAPFHFVPFCTILYHFGLLPHLCQYRIWADNSLYVSKPCVLTSFSSWTGSRWQYCILVYFDYSSQYLVTFYNCYV